MASTRFTRTRAQIAALSRHTPGDPRLAGLREQLQSAVVVHKICIVLDRATVPLTPTLRAEIEALLADREVAAA